MTSLDRLRQAMDPGEKGRPPVLRSEAVKASLGQYGVSAADRLLSSSEVGAELATDGLGLDTITNPEIKALFEKAYAAYQRIFEGGGIAMPTPEELAAGGIDWAHLAELKETYPGRDLVVAPLTLPLQQLRAVISGTANDSTLPDNPLGRYKPNGEDSDGLFINKRVVNHWDDIMASTVKEWQLPVAELELLWTAFLTPSSGESEWLDVSFRDIRRAGLSTIPLTSYVAYQMRRITNGQSPVDNYASTWTLGELMDTDGHARAPFAGWVSVAGQVIVGWRRIGHLDKHLGIRRPLG